MPATINWKPYGIALAITLLVVAVFWALADRPDVPGRRDDAYAAQVAIEHPRVLAAQSLMAGGLVYYRGTLVNRGRRTLTGYTVALTFDDVYGHPLQSVQRMLLDDHVRPIPPHSRRSFEIGFDHVPDGWNQAPPAPRAVAVYVR